MFVVHSVPIYEDESIDIIGCFSTEQKAQEAAVQCYIQSGDGIFCPKDYQIVQVPAIDETCQVNENWYSVRYSLDKLGPNLSEELQKSLKDFIEKREARESELKEISERKKSEDERKRFEWYQNNDPTKGALVYGGIGISSDVYVGGL